MQKQIYIKNKLRYILLLVILFYLLYVPVLYTISPYVFLCLVAIIIVGINISSFRKYVHLFHKEFLLACLLFLFVIFRTAFGGQVVFIRTHFFFLVFKFILPFCCLALFVKSGAENKKSFYNTLLTIGTISSLITCACILSPDINNFVKYTLQPQNEDNDKIVDLFYRGFGISGDLLFSIGITQAFILSFGFLHLKEHKWFIFCIPFFLMAILFNVRTGMIVVAISLSLVFLWGRFSSKVGFLVLGALIFLVARAVLYEVVDTQTLEWGLSFFDEFGNLFASKSVSDSGTMNTLREMAQVRPDGIGEWIFGTGKSQIHAAHHNADIGYINQLMYGGLSYLTILYYLVFRVFKRLYKSGNKLLSLIIFLSVIVVNYKGDIFLADCFTVVMLVSIYEIIVSEKGLSNIYSNYGE